ncbi:metallophosphoesterase, partial [Candidatus Bathyarchaeota archaeon]|nr:metallophosphoesterase [Candidatus Bathyarchaeota archaeon]
VSNKVKSIIICGDFTHFGPVEQAEKFLEILTKTGLPILFVPGNCDDPELAKSKVKGTSCIHGTYVVINGICFLGIGGGAPGPFKTPFELTEEEKQNLLEKAFRLASNPQHLVLVSHMPPHNSNVDVARGGKHIGSKSVRMFIEEREPILALCGHVHESSGVDKIGKTTVVNPGPASKGFCAIVNLDQHSANVQLTSLG